MPESYNLLTIGEVAARARQLARDPFAFAERVRHWSRIGVLHAVENMREGAGKHALFPQSEAYIAAVANAFADAGLPPTATRHSADALAMARDKLNDWLQERSKPRLELLIQIYPGGGFDIEVVRQGVREETSAQQIASLPARGVDPGRRPMTTITIDLGMLFASVSEASANQ